MLGTETHFKYRDGFRLLNSTFLLQSEIISLYFKTETENGINFKAVSKATTAINYLYFPSKYKSYDKTGMEKIVKAFGYYSCQGMSFLIVCSAFASGRNLFSAPAFPNIDHVE